MVGEVNIAVHVAAGKGLMNEWWKIESCTPGGAVLTGGYELPAKCTGSGGYPCDNAAQVALTTTRKWLKTHKDKVDMIMFCVFKHIDFEVYYKYLNVIFPVE
ncbi:ADP-ribose glycohydrolase MACROD1, partial [Geodia barretti]